MIGDNVNVPPGQRDDNESYANFKQTGQADAREPDDRRLRDDMDFISEAIAEITDADIEESLQRTLRNVGFKSIPQNEVVLIFSDSPLDGRVAHVPAGLPPLADTVVALSPAPEFELCGKEHTQTAFRVHNNPAELLHSAPEHIPGHGPRGRAKRSRPHCKEATRPPSRRSLSGHRVLVSGVAAIATAVIVGLATAAGAFSAKDGGIRMGEPPSSARPSASASGGANVAGVSATQAPRAVPTATTGTSNASADTAQALCKAWLTNPWRPGVKNWDEEDFGKLSALAGGPQLVLFYCWTNLPRSYWGSGPAPHFPPVYSNGHWAWPGNQPPSPSQAAGNPSPAVGNAGNG